ncbi:MAG: 50S ribosomal protein L29 [Deltaproteobacteria bacterium]|nr:50S ribosomal protein L29 [Deltaproteobacteria bacterium]MDQ3300914.1 50S ribosomal protein L29 [Myxococcota bacterium]
MSKHTVTLEQMRDQPDDELRQQLARTRDELFRLHLGQHTNQVTSTAQLKVKRRDIARIMTILNGRKQGLEVQAQKAATATTEATTEQPAKKTKKAKS